MRHRVLVHPDFVADLEGHVDWLSEHRSLTFVERLHAAINEAFDLLSTFPAAGSAELREESFRLRKLILRRLPYVVWYVHHERGSKSTVWLVRLFHARQDRPMPAFQRSWKRP